MVLKTSRRPSYEGPRLPYHWRYNLRARESSLGTSADEKPTLKSDAGSSGNRRRRRNKTSVKGDDSKKVRCKMSTELKYSSLDNVFKCEGLKFVLKIQGRNGGWSKGHFPTQSTG